MTLITIPDLDPIGSTLLIDSETYLTELSESELSILGGNASILSFSVVSLSWITPFLQSVIPPASEDTHVSGAV